MDRTIAVPGPPFDLQLSHWDKVIPPSYSKRILCFSLPPSANKCQIIDYLHIALHYTVQRVPFLAGSIVRFPHKQGAGTGPFNISPYGAAYLDIKDLSHELSFSNLANSNFSSRLLRTDKLLPKFTYVQNEPVDVCRFQANFINGGLLLVISIIHLVVDGRGITEVLNIFAGEFRKAQLGDHGKLLAMTKDVYRSDRTALVSGNGVQGKIENHPAWASSLSNKQAGIIHAANASHNFHINSNALSALKQTASPLSPNDIDYISTSDAIAGLIWRSIMIARHRAGALPAGETTSFAQPIDCRPLLRLPEPYFGNAIYVTKTSLPLSTLSDPESGLRAATRAVRADIKSVTAAKFRDLLDYVERTQQGTHIHLNFLENLATSAVFLTSHFKFGMHELDFGPVFNDRHIQAFRLPMQGNFVGAVYVLPRLRDGSCDIMISEQESTLKYLLDDDFFGRFTKG